MNLNLAEAIQRLGPDFAFTLINEARTPADYVFSAILPERPRATFEAKTASMTVRSTMAGLVGMDDNYPPTGIVEGSDFSSGTLKVANEIGLTEQARRELLALTQALAANGGNVNAAVDGTLLNFVDKVLTQAHLDTAEYLRGRALLGQIDWTFNQKRVVVNYGIPSANTPAQVTGTAGYGGSASTFWADVRAMNSRLRGTRARIAHPDTIDMIVTNAANNVRIIAQDEATGTVTLAKIVGTTEQLSSDARDRVTLIAYGAEAEILDPANPGKTIGVPFLSPGIILCIGKPAPVGFSVGAQAVGMGGDVAPNAGVELGYTHIGPTIEGGGQLGRWGRVYVPQNMPMQIVGQAVTNLLPVIETPEKIGVLRTVMA